jgi:hypothetical protein
MESREVDYAGERLEIQLLFEAAVDVLDHGVHALVVFGLAATGGSTVVSDLLSVLSAALSVHDRRYVPWTNRKESFPR